jgi:hypothetical protein
VRSPCLIAIFVFSLLRAHGAASTPVELPIEYREGLLWIKATERQSATPLNLLLDTGAGVSVLNTSAAERLGLKKGRPIDVRGVEAALKGYSLKPLSLTAGDLQLPSPALAVDLQKLSSCCAQRVDGLLGSDFFHGRAVQIDFDAHKMRILPSPPESKLADSLPLQLRACGMRVPISVNGRKAQWVRLDTGCASALQWVTSNVRPEDCMRKTAIGLAELSIPETQTTVRVGQTEFQNVPTGLHEKPIFQGEAGLLGNGLLSRFSSITIDAKSGRLILEPRTAGH